jgi:integrase
MEVIRRKDGRCMVFIPAEESPTGKRQAKYFKFKTGERGADKFIEKYLENRRENGNHAASSQELDWINFARNALGGDLSKLPEVMEHWRKTGANIKHVTARQAVEEFIRWRLAQNSLKPNTVRDIRSRLGRFAKYFGDTPFKQIGPEQVNDFLLTFEHTGNRRSYWKRITPMFKYGSSIKNWVAVNPLTKLTMPEWGQAKRELYTPEQYAKLLVAARDAGDEEVLRYLVLMGTGFLRFSELVGGEVLKWGDIQLDRLDPLINVRKEVAKATRRTEGDERHVDLIEGQSLHTWLSQQVVDKDPAERVIPISEKLLREREKVIFQLAKVEKKDNALRHSSISYYLAMFPDVGVTRVSRWSGNSEATCRKHYLRVLREEQGKAWFHAVDQLIKK